MDPMVSRAQLELKKGSLCPRPAWWVAFYTDEIEGSQAVLY